MGQTLTHGIYLPDEGERNCYNGLAGNWQLLDGAVGTIAEHTTALSGKAPLVHTHTKSDVTDLFNTDNTYSANQNFKNSDWEQGVIPANLTSRYLQFLDKNNSSFGAIGFHQDSNGYTFLNILAGDKYANGAKSTNGSLIRCQFRIGTTSAGVKYQSFDGYWESNLTPLTNNSYDLGSSSYQWNNLYAKNYFYNGVAWGLNQANTWTGRQTYGAYLKSFGEARTDEWSSNSRTNAYLLSRRDADDVSGFLISTFRSNQAQGTAGHIYGWDILENSTRYSGLRFTIDWDSALNSGNGAYKVTLGTNTQGTNPCNDLHITQLKTINGINPGALSLPDYSAEFDVSGQIVPPTGENQISINWGRNTFTPSVNGWLSVRIHKATSIEIYRSIRSSYCVASRVESADDICACSPVVAGVEYTIKIQATQVSPDYDHFRLSPCLGNV